MLTTEMSQEKVAGILGVASGTIAWWEAETKRDISFLGAKNTYTPPDLRVKIPRGNLKYDEIARMSGMCKGYLPLQTES